MHREMEQTKYWMWTRRKLSGRPLLNSSTPMIASYNESWEEQAFAEDSAGHLGGCVWPPRSYSCSFCRREFRSAQALGGHMNVHRRDRARLKQSSSPTSTENDDTHHLHHRNPCMAPLGTQYPPHVSTLVYGTNPNPNPSRGFVATPLSPSRLSGISTQENCRNYSLVSPSYSSSIIQDSTKEYLFSTPRSLIDPIPLRSLNNLELRLGSEKRRLKEVGCWGESDLEETINCKRRRTDPMLPSFIKGHSHHELLKLGPSPIEELDLELRLGDSPKVKLNHRELLLE